MADVSLSPRAQLDLESIVLHVAVVLGAPEAARGIADSVYETLDRLATFPELGAPFEHEELAHAYRRILVGHHWLYYTLDGRNVKVMRIFHERQDIEDYALVEL